MFDEDDLHQFFDILPIGLWRQGQNKRFAWANTAFSRITGFGVDELRTMETIELIKPSWRQFVLDRNKAILNGEYLTPYYFPTRTKKKTELIVMGIIGRIGTRYYGGYIAPLYIDQERDAVSGLYNEIYFYRRLREAVQACYGHKRHSFTLMAIGIDQFKELRKFLELAAIDDFIHYLGDQIIDLMPANAVAARLSEGQFNILFEGQITKDIETIAQSLIDQARNASRSNLNADISLSIAVVEYDENIHGDFDRKMISHAHRAMFRIQAQGGNAVILGPDP